MANIEARGHQWLARKKRQHAAVEGLEYERPGRPSILWGATRGRSRFEINRTYGVESLETIDWIGDPEELLLEAEPVKPEPGDLIYETTARERVTYEALPTADDKCWRWTDSYHQRIRVHCKEIDRVPLGEASHA